ncbi:MAG: hypothetical protein IPH03_02300 [Tetrasphaera sp.]|nr:hypothetical protein [Tetrasphaera sp.]
MGIVNYGEHERTFPNQRVNAGPDQSYLDFRSSSGRCDSSRPPRRGPSTGSDHCSAAASAWDKLSVLDDRHRRVAWEYVAKGRPRQEVAAELGVSPARISQMATRALRDLREALEQEGVKP